MSMLAERRRKTKWVLNPTKKPLWTTDSSGIQFGKDLMEKMGWSAGKGLGAKEQGIQEPLRVSYKHDTKGIGFKGNDNEWIEQQDEFNEFLKHLRNDDDAVETSENTKPELRSLENKSKHSRARLHYQKLVRGKDLSRYSDHDLACILGVNKKEKKEKSDSEETPKPDAKANSNSNSEFETSFGVTTIKSGFIHDYFKNKYKTSHGNLTKTKDEGTENNNEGFTNPESVGNTNEEPDAEEGSKEKKRKKKLKLENLSGDLETEIDCENSRNNGFDCPQAEEGGKKVKKRKPKSNAIDVGETTELDKKENKTPETCTEEEPKAKKRKKKDNSNDETKENDFEMLTAEGNPCKGDDKNILVMSNEDSEMVESEEKKMKRKKHKLKSETETEQVGECEGFDMSETDPPEKQFKKKHKHKNKEKDLKEGRHKEKREKSQSDKCEFEEENDFYKNEGDQSTCKKEEFTGSVEEENGSLGKKKKRKQKSSSGEVHLEGSDVSCQNDSSVNTEGNKHKEKKSKLGSGEEKVIKASCEPIKVEGDYEEEKERKKKKKKSSAEGTLEDREAISGESARLEILGSLPVENENEISSTKKKKKKKKSEKSEIVAEDECNEENVDKKEKKRKSKLKNSNNQDVALNNNSEEIGTLDVDGTTAGEVEVTEVIKTHKKKKDKKEKRKEKENGADSTEIETKSEVKKKKSEKREKVKLVDVQKAEDCSKETVTEGNVKGKNANDSEKATKDASAVGNGPSGGRTDNQGESVQYKSYTKQKVLDLIAWANIKEFKGSNLGNVLGYGFKKEYINSSTVS